MVSLQEQISVGAFQGVPASREQGKECWLVPARWCPAPHSLCRGVNGGIGNREHRRETWVVLFKKRAAAAVCVRETIMKLLCFLALYFVSGAQTIQEFHLILNYFFYNYCHECACEVLWLGFSTGCLSECGALKILLRLQLLNGIY